MKTRKKLPRIIAPAKTEKLNGFTTTKSLVQLVNIKTGRLIDMSAKAAGLLCSKYPREFKIL